AKEIKLLQTVNKLKNDFSYLLVYRMIIKFKKTNVLYRQHQTIFVAHRWKLYLTPPTSFCFAGLQFFLRSYLCKSFDMPLLFSVDQYDNYGRLLDFPPQDSTTDPR